MAKLFVVFLSIFLAGCASSPTLYSNTFIKPPQPISGIKVLYLENVATDFGTKNPTDISDIGYPDLPKLFRDRVPVVFDLNNIHNDYATLPKPNFGQREAIQAVKWSNIGNTYSTILIIEVVSGSEVGQQDTSSTVFVYTRANLIDTRTNIRLWTGQFINGFMRPSAGHVVLGSDSTDLLLKIILEQMDKDGVIKLKEGNVFMPKKESENNESQARN